MFAHRVCGLKFWTTQPNWHDVFVNGDFRPKLWTPQLNLHGMFVKGFGPKVLDKPVIYPVTLNSLYL